jgi:pimeloyl-ACP methyl ester carboxylesterase
MHKVTSRDGTQIAFDRVGDGPAVVIIGSGPTDHWAAADVAAQLAAHFTVITYDRRGRGESGDTAPYSLDREYEDLAALIDAAGGSARIYGTSGGGFLGLEAAARGLPISKLAVWEPPYVIDDTRPAVPPDYKQQLDEMLAAGRHGDMVELFLTKAALVPAEFIAGMRQGPFWPSMEAVAPALVYDAILAGDFSIPTDRLVAVKVPTLVIDGATTTWLTNAADRLAVAIPGSRRRTLAGQPHNVAAEVIAPALIEFFSETP